MSFLSALIAAALLAAGDSAWSLSCCDGTAGQTNCVSCSQDRVEIYNAQYQLDFFQWAFSQFDQNRRRLRERPAAKSQPRAVEIDCAAGMPVDDANALCARIREVSGVCARNEWVLAVRGRCDDWWERRAIAAAFDRLGGRPQEVVILGDAEQERRLKNPTLQELRNDLDLEVKHEAHLISETIKEESQHTRPGRWPISRCDAIGDGSGSREVSAEDIAAQKAMIEREQSHQGRLAKRIDNLEPLYDNRMIAALREGAELPQGQVEHARSDLAYCRPSRGAAPTRGPEPANPTSFCKDQKQRLKALLANADEPARLALRCDTGLLRPPKAGVTNVGWERKRVLRGLRELELQAYQLDVMLGALQGDPAAFKELEEKPEFQGVDTGLIRKARGNPRVRERFEREAGRIEQMANGVIADLDSLKPLPKSGGEPPKDDPELERLRENARKARDRARRVREEGEKRAASGRDE
ncbi:MAG: hypothetical protein HY554_10630 [Elusimicrobia bacterium]|nr:hypothetical protein [Elusimicrobiota bacterium]